MARHDVDVLNVLESDAACTEFSLYLQGREHGVGERIVFADAMYVVLSDESRCGVDGAARFRHCFSAGSSF
jgi:hypothetical protein